MACLFFLAPTRIMNSPTNSCLFCAMPQQRIIAENPTAYAIRDGFPVTEGHCLIIPRRHVPDFFSLTEQEAVACNSLLKTVRELVLHEDQTVAGFNVGVNAGEVAGQTIFHCHIHLIPRRAGDVPNPRGGVRHTIPGKGNY